jgi:hypothetical protein
MPICSQYAADPGIRPLMRIGIFTAAYDRLLAHVGIRGNVQCLLTNTGIATLHFSIRFLVEPASEFQTLDEWSE